MVNMGKTQVSWSLKFAELKEHLQNSNGVYPTMDNYRLYVFMRHNKALYAMGKLPEEREKMFESLPNWKWRVARKSVFMIQLNEYLNFIKTHGRKPRTSSNQGTCKYQSHLQHWFLRNNQFYRHGHMITRFRPAFEMLLREIRNMHIEANATQLELI
jgi:hypothetical protein